MESTHLSNVGNNEERKKLFDPMFGDDFFVFGKSKTLEINVDFALPEGKLEDFFEPKNKAGEVFITAFTKAIDKIVVWADDKRINIKPLLDFKQTYAIERRTGALYFPLYHFGVPALVGISELINNKDIPLEFRKDKIRNLINSIDVCGPGTYTNITNIYMELYAYINLPQKWLMIRREISQQIVLTELQKHKYSKAVEIHYVNGVLNRFADTLGINMLEDEYVNLCNDHLLNSLIETFYKTVSAHLTPENVVNNVMTELDLPLLEDKICKATDYPFLTLKDFEEEKVLRFGIEDENHQFYYVDDLIIQYDSKDQTKYNLSWKAKYVLFISLFVRLANNKVFKTDEFEKIELTKENAIFYIPSKSIKFAYLYSSNDPAKKTKPLIPHIVNVLSGLEMDETLDQTYPESKKPKVKDLFVAYERKLKEFLLLNLNESQRKEIIDASILYLQSAEYKNSNENIQAQREKNLIEAIVRLLPKDFTSTDVFSLLRDLPIRSSHLLLQQNQIDIDQLIKDINNEIELNLILRTIPLDKFKLYFSNLSKKFEEITLLYHAVINQNYEIVNYLLASPKIKSKINKLTANGNGVIHAAAVTGNFEIFKLLVDNGAKIEKESRAGLNAFHKAAQFGQIEIIQKILEFNPTILHIKAKDGSTALHIAAQNGQNEVIETLIQEKINLNAETREGYSALHIAARYGQTETVKLLIEKYNMDKTINIKNDLPTPLALAVLYRHKDTAKFLLKKDVDLKFELIKDTDFYLSFVQSQHLLPDLNFHFRKPYKLWNFNILHLVVLTENVELLRTILDKMLEQKINLIFTGELTPTKLSMIMGNKDIETLLGLHDLFNFVPEGKGDISILKKLSSSFYERYKSTEDFSKLKIDYFSFVKLRVLTQSLRSIKKNYNPKENEERKHSLKALDQLTKTALEQFVNEPRNIDKIMTDLINGAKRISEGTQADHAKNKTAFRLKFFDSRLAKEINRVVDDPRYERYSRRPS